MSKIAKVAPGISGASPFGYSILDHAQFQQRCPRSIDASGVTGFLEVHGAVHGKQVVFPAVNPNF